MFKKTMKTLAVLLALSMMFTACNETVVPEIQEPEEEITDGGPNIPMDTALYRGILTAKTEDSVTVEAPMPGRNYGPVSLTVLIGENTNSELPIEEYELGDYLEVYYGGTEQPTAVHILRRPAYDMVVYNGTVTAVVKNETDEITSVTVQKLDSEEIIVFNIAPESQVYMSADQLVEGAQVSILHSGAIAESFPAQGFAIELSPLFVPGA